MQFKTFLFRFSFLYNFIPIKFLMKLSRKKIIYPFYHYVEDKNNENKLTSHLYKAKNRLDFIKDINFFKKHFQSLSIQDFLDNNLPKENYSFLLSFDDGLSNFFNVVVPIIEEKKINVINFLNTGFIDNKALFYRYKINLIIDFLKTNNLTKKQLKNLCELLVINNFQLNKVYSLLKALKYEDVVKIDAICSVLDIDIELFLRKNKPYLSSNQIQNLLKKGIYFGAHSVSHPKYSDIPYFYQILETKDSIQYLEKNFNIKKVSFAFPFSYDNISLDFFQFLKSNKIISFGTAGLKNEQIEIDNIQRIPMEYKKSKYSAQTILKGELILFLLKRILKKHIILRTRIQKS